MARSESIAACRACGQQMQVVPQAGDNLSLTGHTLVIAGAGNAAGLGELAVDAVITTFGLSRVATVQSPLLLPVVMSSAWKPALEQQSGRLELTTGAELFQSEAVPALSVLQMRSPPVEGRRFALAKEIWAWASSVGVLQIVIVAGCAQWMRQDADLNAITPLRFAHASLGDSDELTALLAKAGLSEFVLPLLPVAAPEEPAAPEEVCAEPRDIVAELRVLRGGGLTRPLLFEAAEAAAADAGAKTKALALTAFTSSIVDMRTLEQLAKAACALTAAKLGVQPPAMKFPQSWALQAESAAKLPVMYD